MSVHCRITGLVLLACALGTPLVNTANAQQSATGVRPSANPIRMRVIESAPERGQKPAYAILGAVRQSGVYLAETRELPLWRLIDAAGGLRPDANPFLRVIRNGQPRLQVQFDPARSGDSNILLPGDVVVVSSNMPVETGESAAVRPVPVACLGLINRPVVLPLSNPPIATVSDLVRRLWQAPDLAKTARVIHPGPVGRDDALTAGTVIVFDPQRVDPVGLSRTEPLPPAIDLEAFAGCRDGHPPSANAPDSHTGSTSNEAVPASPATGATSATETPLLLETPEAVQVVVEPLRAVAERESSTTGLNALNQPVADVHVPEWDPMSAASLELSVLPPLTFFRKQRTPPGPLNVEMRIWRQSAERVPHIQPLPGTALVSSEMIASPGTVQLTQGIEPTPTEPTSTGPDGPDLVTRSDAAPAPPIERRNSLTSNERLAERRAFTTRMTDMSAGAVRNDAAQTWPVATGAALLIALCLSASMLLSKWDRRPRARSTPNVARVQSGPQIGTADATANVRELVSRSIPVVEEQVVVPSQWPLHGKVIGHRRIILNAAHQTIDGPYFVRSERRRGKHPDSSSNVIDERSLRESLKAAVRSIRREAEPGWGDLAESQIDEISRAGTSPDGEPVARVSDYGSHFSTASPAPPNPTSPVTAENVPAANADETRAFDVVQPATPRSQTAASGPLERALRTLALEKRR